MHTPSHSPPDEVLAALPEVRLVRLHDSGGDALTPAAVEGLHTALDEAEADPDCRLVVLVGADGVFCTGLDVAHAAEHIDGDVGLGDGDRFWCLLRRFTSCSRVVVSAVDGWVSGGGVGLAAASDVVVASPRSRFALPEALWGLVPCCVLPFLVRRVGIQKASAMALTTSSIESDDALRIGLADELAADPVAAVRRLAVRARMFDETVVGEIKGFARALWSPSAELEQFVRAEFRRLTTSDVARSRISGYATNGRLPWEKGGASWSR